MFLLHVNQTHCPHLADIHIMPHSQTRTSFPDVFQCKKNANSLLRFSRHFFLKNKCFLDRLVGKHANRMAGHRGRKTRRLGREGRFFFRAPLARSKVTSVHRLERRNSGNVCVRLLYIGRRFFGGSLDVAKRNMKVMSIAVRLHTWNPLANFARSAVSNTNNVGHIECKKLRFCFHTNHG